jgi:hypothetical protein
MTPVLLAVFFVFGTAMTALASLSLAWPDGPLAAMWRLKPDEFAKMRALGPLVPIGFSALSLTMAVTAYATLARRRWGWWLAVFIFAVNGLSDAARALVASEWSSLIGVAVAGLVLWWLSRRDVRAMFGR